MPHLSNNPAGFACEKGSSWQRQSPCGETPKEGTVPIRTGVGTADQRDTFTTTVTTPIRALHDLSVGSPSESCWTRRRRSGPRGPCWATSACTGEVQAGVTGVLAHASGSRKAGWFMAAEHNWMRGWAGRRTAGCLQTPGLPVGRQARRVGASGERSGLSEPGMGRWTTAGGARPRPREAARTRRGPCRGSGSRL